MYKKIDSDDGNKYLLILSSKNEKISLKDIALSFGASPHVIDVEAAIEKCLNDDSYSESVKVEELLTVEKVARECCASITDLVSKQTQLLILGSGFYSVIAMEMAYQCRGQNISVPFVGLVNGSSYINYSKDEISRIKLFESASSDGLSILNENTKQFMASRYHSMDFTGCKFYENSLISDPCKIAFTNYACGEYKSNRNVINVSYFDGIESLGQCLHQDLADASPTDTSVNQSPLVTMKKSRLPANKAIILAPGAGDSLMSFMPLLSKVNEASDVYGIHYRGLVEGAPYTSIESAVEKIKNDVLNVARTVDCAIVGHSYGGWIATELAITLAKNTPHKVSLYIVDSQSPSGGEMANKEYNTHPAYIDTITGIKRLIEILEMHTKSDFPIASSTLADLSITDIIKNIHYFLIQQNKMPAATDIMHTGFMVKSFLTNIRTQFIPSDLFKGNVYYFSAASKHEKGESEHGSQKHEKWQEYFDNMQHHTLGGDHVSMLSSENVGPLANLL